jgi:hypothetical protein
VRDPVRVVQARGRVDVEFGAGVQPVPEPTHPQAAHREDPASAASAASTRLYLA